MTRVTFGIIILLLSASAVLSGSPDRGMTHEFLRDDASYSFRGSFHVKADPECLIDVVFDIKHIINFTAGARSIELLDQGNSWNEVQYVYRRYMIFENTSSWRRTLNKDEQKVAFEMIFNQNNMGIMPDILASSGYYQITPGETECRIEYYQTCTLKPGFLKDTFINRAEKEAIEFLREFKDYVIKTCEIE